MLGESARFTQIRWNAHFHPPCPGSCLFWSVPNRIYLLFNWFSLLTQCFLWFMTYQIWSESLALTPLKNPWDLFRGVRSDPQGKEIRKQNPPRRIKTIMEIQIPGKRISPGLAISIIFLAKLEFLECFLRVLWFSGTQQVSWCFPKAMSCFPSTVYTSFLQMSEQGCGSKALVGVSGMCRLPWKHHMLASPKAAPGSAKENGLQRQGWGLLF